MEKRKIRLNSVIKKVEFSRLTGRMLFLIAGTLCAKLEGNKQIL